MRVGSAIAALAALALVATPARAARHLAQLTAVVSDQPGKDGLGDPTTTADGSLDLSGFTDALNANAPGLAELFANQSDSLNALAPGLAELFANQSDSLNALAPGLAELFANQSDSLNALAPGLAELFANQSDSLNANAAGLAELFANQSDYLNALAPGLAELFANQSDYLNSIIDSFGNQSAVWDAILNGSLSPSIAGNGSDTDYDSGSNGSFGDDEPEDADEDGNEVDLSQFPFLNGFPPGFFDAVFTGSGFPAFAMPPSGEFAPAPLPDGFYPGNFSSIIAFFQSLFNASTPDFDPNFPQFGFPNLTDLLDSLEALPPLPSYGDYPPYDDSEVFNETTALPPLSQDVQEQLQDALDGLQSLFDSLGLWSSGRNRRLLQASPSSPARPQAVETTSAVSNQAAPPSTEPTPFSTFLQNVLNATVPANSTLTSVSSDGVVVSTTTVTTASGGSTTSSVVVITPNEIAATKGDESAALAPAPSTDLSDPTGFALFVALLPWFTPNLLASIHYGHVGAVQYALNAGQNPNARNDRGRTALHEAVTAPASERQSRIVLELLDNGADPTISDNDGVLPIDLAFGVLDLDTLYVLGNLTAELEGLVNDLLASAPSPLPTLIDIDFDLDFGGDDGGPEDPTDGPGFGQPQDGPGFGQPQGGIAGPGFGQPQGGNGGFGQSQGAGGGGGGFGPSQGGGDGGAGFGQSQGGGFGPGQK